MGVGQLKFSTMFYPFLNNVGDFCFDKIDCDAIGCFRIATVEQVGGILENGYTMMLELLRGHKLGIHDNSHIRTNCSFHFRLVIGIEWY